MDEYALPYNLALQNLVKKLTFLDQLVEMGEEPYEIESEVHSCSHLTSVLFFGWLMDKGIDEGTEVLASMSKHFFEDLYLNDEEPCNRRYTLATISKKRLSQFINLIDFAVSDELWNQKVNPFDGILLLYQFLNYAGYPANLARRERALKELRRRIVKKPCSLPQTGSEMIQ